MPPHLPIPNLAEPHATARLLNLPFPIHTYEPQYVLIGQRVGSQVEIILHIGTADECDAASAKLKLVQFDWIDVEPILWGTRTAP